IKKAQFEFLKRENGNPIYRIKIQTAKTGWDYLRGDNDKPVQWGGDDIFGENGRYESLKREKASQRLSDETDYQTQFKPEGMENMLMQTR
ncbi:MAG: hypothetical protein GY869_27515, partial [Planctomycetes bacterium]|nr:hypothetical protein [Planctomycetota bacterium]